MTRLKMYVLSLYLICEVSGPWIRTVGVERDPPEGAGAAREALALSPA